ncbi:MAG: hypothetical protein ACRBFS_23305 [Aureispira sp.]
MFVRKFNSSFFVGATALLITACEAPNNTTTIDVVRTTDTIVEEPIVKEMVTPKTTTNPYLIENNTFYGLSLGMSISAQAARLEKGVLSDGESDFEVYYIKGEEGEELGYIMPDLRDESLIGSIIITTAKAITTDGLALGSTFKDLQTQTPNIQVHGSEIEGRTHAIRGNELFLLDLYEVATELEENNIDPTTVIKAITIQ